MDRREAVDFGPATRAAVQFVDRAANLSPTELTGLAIPDRHKSDVMWALINAGDNIRMRLAIHDLVDQLRKVGIIIDESGFSLPVPAPNQMALAVAAAEYARQAVSGTGLRPDQAELIAAIASTLVLEPWTHAGLVDNVIAPFDAAVPGWRV